MSDPFLFGQAYQPMAALPLKPFFFAMRLPQFFAW
jgi:hypothetical protein